MMENRGLPRCRPFRAAVGQTTGNSITLDTNAAGNGWFTPWDNREFPPNASYGGTDGFSYRLSDGRLSS